jgi:hypothetical protein
LLPDASAAPPALYWFRAMGSNDSRGGRATSSRLATI